jgi:large subunit ribosomal protein LP2
MRHLAAYLLLVLGGNASPSAADIKSVLSAAGIEADDADIGRLLPAVEGKDLNALIEAGKKKIVSVGGGGAAPAAGGAAAGAGGAAPAAAKKEEKKEEEEEEVGGAGGLFGDDDDF